MNMGDVAQLHEELFQFLMKYKENKPDDWPQLFLLVPARCG